MSLIENFIGLLSGGISQADMDRAALLLLDWTACAVAGKAELSPNFLDVLDVGSGQSVRIGAAPGDVKSSAFHNGCLGNVLEMDDVDRQAILHPGPTVIPAALSVATQRADCQARDLLSAIIAGYEATIRIGRAAGAGHYAFWHSTGTCGVFGAAIAASRLMGSDAEQALNLAGTLSAGLWQTRHDASSHGKQIHTGHAASTGVNCALLAKSGVRGPSEILSGPHGFFQAMCAGADPMNILKDYGQAWLVHETSLKPYPACRHAHPSIDAALLASRDGDGQFADIWIETYDDAIKFCDKPEPQSVIEAKFSLQHNVAHSLLFGAPGLNAFSSEAVTKTSELRRHIKVKPSDEFNAEYPAHFGAAITIGPRRYVANDAYGDPENPMDKAAVIDKSMQLFDFGGMNLTAAKTLCDTTLALAETARLSDYVKALP